MKRRRHNSKNIGFIVAILMKIFIPTTKYIIVFYLILLCSCQRSIAINTNSGIKKYRKPLAPLESLPLGKKQHNISAQRAYIAWQVEHDNLVSSLNRGRLAVYESHRRILGHLDTLIQTQSYSISRMLKAYQELYINLLDEVERNVSSRILEKKYHHLKQEILNCLNQKPTT